MPDERDGRHAGGSPVDTTRANTSPEKLAREQARRDKEKEQDKTDDTGGR